MGPEGRRRARPLSGAARCVERGATVALRAMAALTGKWDSVGTAFQPDEAELRQMRTAYEQILDDDSGEVHIVNSNWLAGRERRSEGGVPSCVCSCACETAGN